MWDVYRNSKGQAAEDVAILEIRQTDWMTGSCYEVISVRSDINSIPEPGHSERFAITLSSSACQLQSAIEEDISAASNIHWSCIVDFESHIGNSGSCVGEESLVNLCI